MSSRDSADARRGRATPPPALQAPSDARLYRVVFVCSGNICRSPMAEVVTRQLAETTRLDDGTVLGDHLEVQSAGTGPWHEGEPMHPFAADALVRAGYPRHPHVARQFRRSDLGAVDLLVGLDRRHQQTLRGLGADPERLALLRAFDPASGAAADVPDPYYGDEVVFDACLDMIAAGCSGLVADLAGNWETLWAA
jgi:protein-tyrosine phosphatase